MKIQLHNWLTVFLIAALAGCEPEGPQALEDLDLVYTNYSTDFNFKTQKTFSLPDSIIKINGDEFKDPDGDGKPQFLSDTYAKPILARIKSNMADYGWTLVGKNSNPDVVLLPSSMTTTNMYYYYDWWYWDWWYPGWHDWGWWYPGIYYPVAATGYRSGSVFIQMVDHKAALQSDNAPVVWSAILNGLAEGSTTNINNRLQKSIDKAFAQSPYLKH